MGVGTLKMIGRTRERERLERWLDGVRGGASGCAAVEGEAGIGKSMLVAWVCEAARGMSFEVFRGGADELDRARPFGALGVALGIAPTVLDAAAAGAPGAPYRAVDGLVEYVEARALRAPVLLAVEDLQWADRETLVALRAVGGRLAHLPVALLTSFRPWPRRPELAMLVESWSREGALTLGLAPLAHDGVIELATELLGARPGPALADQLDAAGGNPLFVRELVGALGEDGAIRVTGDCAELERGPLPPSLRLTILRRLATLDLAAVQLLQRASLLGSSFSLADLATVLERRPAEVLEALMDVKQAGVVEEYGEQLRFRHELVREALYRDLPASARRALHRDAGLLLAAAGTPALQVAGQLSLGVEPGDREAAVWIARAARESAVRAPLLAVELFERAIVIAGVDDPARAQLSVERAEALVWAGRPGDAQASAEQLLARPLGRELRDRARTTVVRALWLESRWQELASRVAAWLDGEDLADSHRASLLADMAMAQMFLGDHAAGERAAQAALAIGEIQADERIIFAALYALSPLYNARGDYAAELDASARALAIAEQGDNPDLARYQPHFAHAMSLNSHDRYAEAEEMFSVGLRLREELGTVWDLPLYQAGLADLHCQTGSWDHSLAEAETGVTTAEEVGTRVGVAVCASIAAFIHAHRDALDDAERFLGIAEEEIARSGPQWGTSYWTCLARAQIAEAHGDGTAALAELAGAWERQAGAGGLRAYLGPELVRLALLHEPARAQPVVESLGAELRDSTVGSVRGSVLLCAGRVTGERELLERAVAAFAECGWVLQHAAACEALAAVVAASAPAEARAVFETALELYQRLDARRDSARVLGAMRAAGLRRGSRAAHRHALKGWDSLTATESEVVRLCVAGLTNREIGERLFISRRTVQTHLSHAFTKLEVSSRVALAALATARARDEISS